jgi:hypothetical protein
MMSRLDLIRTNQCIGLVLSHLFIICDHEYKSGFSDFAELGATFEIFEIFVCQLFHMAMNMNQINGHRYK